VETCLELPVILKPEEIKALSQNIYRNFRLTIISGLAESISGHGVINRPRQRPKGGKRMKKTLSKEGRAKEAAFWTKLHQAVKENPGKICHK
jgi:hypothetical protein